MHMVSAHSPDFQLRKRRCQSAGWIGHNLPPTMYAIYFRWKVTASRALDFEHAWLELTKLLRDERGGLGSRLHRCADGDYFAYAQWPSKAFWASQPAPTARMVALRNQMRECAELVDGPRQGDVVADLLVSSTPD